MGEGFSILVISFNFILFWFLWLNVMVMVTLLLVLALQSYCKEDRVNGTVLSVMVFSSFMEGVLVRSLKMSDSEDHLHKAELLSLHTAVHIHELCKF